MKRVIIGSFGAALLLGAIYLGLESLSNMRVKCEDGGHPECAFIEQTAHEVGRTQALGATGCALAGGGALLFVRSLRGQDKGARAPAGPRPAGEDPGKPT